MTVRWQFYHVRHGLSHRSSTIPYMDQQNRTTLMSISLSTDDLRDLSTARQLLENQSLAARMTHLIGTPINKGLDILPNGWQGRIGDITQMALNQVADAVLFTPDKVPGKTASTVGTSGVRRSATGREGSSVSLAWR